jgi:hypothetical protein
VPIRDDDRIGDVPADETPPAAEHELAAIVRKIDKPIGNHQSVASHTLHTHHLLTPQSGLRNLHRAALRCGIQKLLISGAEGTQGPIPRPKAARRP